MLVNQGSADHDFELNGTPLFIVPVSPFDRLAESCRMLSTSGSRDSLFKHLWKLVQRRQGPLLSYKVVLILFKLVNCEGFASHFSAEIADFSFLIRPPVPWNSGDRQAMPNW